MHELGIMTSVMEVVDSTAKANNATKVLEVSLAVGEMTEAIEDALRFAFDVLKEGTLSEEAELKIRMIKPESLCPECGEIFEHDRFHRGCPKCGNMLTQLLKGKEMQIDSIEVDIPDEDEE